MTAGISSQQPLHDPAALCLHTVENAPFAFATVEGASRIVLYCNPAFAKIAGKSDSSITGIPLDEIFSETSCLELLNQVYSSHLPSSTERKETSQSDNSVFSFSMWPLETNPKLIGVLVWIDEHVLLQRKTLEMNEALVLGSVRQHALTEASQTLNAGLNIEISERKQIEAELQTAHLQLSDRAIDLEALVNERTAVLLETNRELETSVESNRQASEKYRTLLLESEKMQEDLRLLTRQFLTAHEADRQAISRDLHDDILQPIAGINVELTALVKRPSIDIEVLKTGIAKAQGLMETSVESIYEYARDLRPSVLDDLGLNPAIEGYLKDFTERTGIEIRFSTCDEVETLSTAERTAFFRVAQEGLINISRHANVKQAEIQLRCDARFITMEIKDHGAGFELNPVNRKKNSSRLGLLSMEERIEMIGGFFSIDSALNTGTRITATIPRTAG